MKNSYTVIAGLLILGGCAADALAADDQSTEAIEEGETISFEDRFASLTGSTPSQIHAGVMRSQGEWAVACARNAGVRVSEELAENMTMVDLGIDPYGGGIAELRTIVALQSEIGIEDETTLDRCVAASFTEVVNPLDDYQRAVTSFSEPMYTAVASSPAYQSARSEADVCFAEAVGSDANPEDALSELSFKAAELIDPEGDGQMSSSELDEALNELEGQEELLAKEMNRCINRLHETEIALLKDLEAQFLADRSVEFDAVVQGVLPALIDGGWVDLDVARIGE